MLFLFNDVFNRPSYRYLVVGAAVTVASAFVSAAQAQNLFEATPNDPARQSAARLASPMVIRARSVMINRTIAAAEFARTKKKRNVITIELFSGKTVRLAPREVTAEKGDPTVVWSGSIVGEKHGSATLLARDGGIFGQVQIGQEIYRIDPKSGGVHTISQIRPERFKTDIAIPAPGSHRPAPMRAAPAPNAAPPPRIDVLVMFSNKARLEAIAAGTTIQNEARLAIALANTAYGQTRLRHRLRFAGARILGCFYNETNFDYAQSLYDITNASTCIGQRAANFRTQLKADLVAVLRSSGSYCGIAWVNENPAGQSGYGFSVTSRTCISNHSFAHEVGHNLGLQHDRFVSTGTQSEYNFGYVAVADRVRSVMAYNSLCSSQGFNCTRVPVFSNTTVLGRWNGTIPMGRRRVDGDYANNRRQILRNWAAIAAWY